MTRPAIEMSNVEMTYAMRSTMFSRRRTLKAVSNVTLSINQGEVVGLVGESGCGKSTLARLLLGLETPSAGSITLDGVDISRFRRIELARRIQPVFQDPYSSLNPRKTIGQIVELPMHVLDIHRSGERRDRAAEMLERVGLPPQTASRYPSQLSGGQRQRVAIARALVAEPEMVICDEATSALDVSVQAQILNLLLDLKDSLGLTYLFISHNLAVVEHVADRVAVMYLGRIVEEAPTATLFAHALHPYTKALLSSALTVEPGLGVPDIGLKGTFPNALDPPGGCPFHPRCLLAEDQCRQLEPQLSDRGIRTVACHVAARS